MSKTAETNCPVNLFICYGDIICMNSPVYTLKPLDAVYHSALRFKTEDGFIMHRCLLYEKVGGQSHCILFIYKALLGKLTGYLLCLLNFKSSWQVPTLFGS